MAVAVRGLPPAAKAAAAVASEAQATSSRLTNQYSQCSPFQSELCRYLHSTPRGRGMAASDIVKLAETLTLHESKISDTARSTATAAGEGAADGDEDECGPTLLIPCGGEDVRTPLHLADSLDDHHLAAAQRVTTLNPCVVVWSQSTKRSTFAAKHQGYATHFGPLGPTRTFSK